MNLLVIGLYINSALYLIGCFAAGFMLQNPWAWKQALISAGLSFVTYNLQLNGFNRTACGAIAALSVVIAFFAGLSLLVQS